MSENRTIDPSTLLRIDGERVRPSMILQLYSGLMVSEVEPSKNLFDFVICPMNSKSGDSEENKSCKVSTACQWEMLMKHYVWRRPGQSHLKANQLTEIPRRLTQPFLHTSSNLKNWSKREFLRRFISYPKVFKSSKPWL